MKGSLASGAALVALALAGCYLGGSDPTPEPAPVGPAPLRRMTNGEYLDALQDLFPGVAPELPPLPNDTVVAGFDDAAEAQQPSDVRIARFEQIANLYAEGATRDTGAVRALVGCDWATPTDASACATQFITDVGRRIYRRPLSTEERDRLYLRFLGWQAAVDFEGAVRLTLSTMLQAPQFLYRPEPVPRGSGAGALAPVEPYAMASRLSFFLWQSIPDEVLLRAAERDELRTEAQLRAQAERMLDDPRAKRVLWSFHRQWLGLDRILSDEGALRSNDVDPAWTSATATAAWRESELFVENVLSAHGTFGDLLESRRAWVNADLARIYGVPAPAGDELAPVTLPEGERAGILTRVAFLGGTSHRGGTSPPIRGNALSLRFLCSLPQSPPPGADLSMPTATPEQGPQTTRMLFEARTAPAQCRSCHVALNGIGFGFEHYDAAGKFRTTEVGLPIDAHGTLLGTDVDRAFDGALALGPVLSESALVQRCVTSTWLRFALGRAPESVEAPLVTELARGFAASGGDVRELLVAIVSSPTFRLRRSD